MARNGKIPTGQLAELPRSWSNRDRQEFLTRAAYESFSRMIARAVAETGVNFQLYDAYRSYSEQVEMLKRNYEPARSGKSYNTYRTLNGTRYGQKAGRPITASPGHSNHGLAISVDVHPGPIHEYLRKNGARNGWVADVGYGREPWHWSYKHPSRDQYRAEGLLDHAAVQKAVGAEVDGKIGTGTVEKIKAFQKEHGLEVDGKVGSATKAAMGLGKGSAAPAAPAVPAGGTSVPAPSPAKEPDAILTPGASGGFVYTYTREQWDTQGVEEGVHAYDAPVQGIYIHWPGSSGSFKGLSPEEIARILRGYRRDHVDGNGWRDIAYGAAVDWAGRTYQLRGLDMEVGSNGGDKSNSEAGSILYLLGTRETPTPEMIEGGNGLLAQYADTYGKGYIDGHRDSPDADTTCPGARLMGLIEDGSINWDGSAAETIPGEVIENAGLSKVVVDGRWGTDTTKALQRFLNTRVKSRVLTIDGRMGPDTWRSLQEYLQHPVVDGLIENQSYKPEELGNGISENGWEYTGRGSKGSKTIRRLQRWTGVEDDGIVFEATTAALQEKLNQHGDFAG